MNNVKNDERYFVTDNTKKFFSWKLDENEFNKIISKQRNFFEMLPITQPENLTETLNSLIKAKENYEINLKEYIRNCVRTPIFDIDKVCLEIKKRHSLLKEMKDCIEYNKKYHKKSEMYATEIRPMTSEEFPYS